MRAQSETKRSVGRRPIDWILQNVDLRSSNAAEFWFDRMPSQSGWSLPVIHCPFDGTKRGHFVDRGRILDFAITAGPGRVLDFGPGDGWPSLLIAPRVTEVVGVEGSRRRVETCARNADKLGVANARFVHVPPGRNLPFDNAEFDAVVAASSVEQTPDPKATLAELARVLKPGGRLRISYESLGYYHGRREREIALSGENQGPTCMLVFDRHVGEECVHHYGLVLDLSRTDVTGLFARHGADPAYEALSEEVLEALWGHVTDAATWTTRHPSGSTLVRWLRDAGFTLVRPTRSGRKFAATLFESLAEAERPVEMEAVDARLRPGLEQAVRVEADAVAPPGEWDPMITAVR